METELILSDLNTQERSLLKSLSAEDSTVELNPKDLNPDQLWSALNICGRVVGGMERAARKIKPILGRILVALHDNPEVVSANGFKNFEDLMGRGMEEMFGISRSEAYHLSRIASKFPSLTPAEYEEIGVAKLQLLAKETNETDRSCKKLMEKAKELTVAELKEHLCERGSRDKGELDFAMIQIKTSRAFARRWKEFCEDSHVLAWAGNNDPQFILEALMQEASTEIFHSQAQQEVA